jgi:hypothetical protein
VERLARLVPPGGLRREEATNAVARAAPAHVPPGPLTAQNRERTMPNIPRSSL